MIIWFKINWCIKLYIHWTQHAKHIWKDSHITLFDAMSEMECFYKYYLNSKDNIRKLVKYLVVKNLLYEIG